jgi:hypothetical protein
MRSEAQFLRIPGSNLEQLDWQIRILLGRLPRDEGQLPDSNKHMVGEGLGCAAVPTVADVSLQIRPSPILSLLVARVSTRERRMTLVLRRYSGVAQGSTSRLWRR